MKRKNNTNGGSNCNSNIINKKSKNNNVKNNNNNSSNKEKQYNKRNPLLLAGSKGFLFTCDTMRQREAVREAYNLLDEYIEILYPSLIKKKDVDNNDNNNDNNNNNKPKNMREMLKSEINSVKNNNSKSKKLSSQKYIKKVDSGATGLILMVCSNTNDIIKPVEIAEKICRDMLQTKKQKSRFLIRIQPYEIGGSTDENELIQSLNILLNRKPILLHSKNNNNNNNNNDNNDKSSFKIVYKRRNHDKSLRTTINKLADEIDEHKHKVNLNKPNIAILLNIIKGTSFLSILPCYTELKEYNFRKIIDDKSSEKKK